MQLRILCAQLQHLQHPEPRLEKSWLLPAFCKDAAGLLHFAVEVCPAQL
jgi:hypothetical protein